jgi:tetratricopeptide (TPR) repeat protein
LLNTGAYLLHSEKTMAARSAFFVTVGLLGSLAGCSSRQSTVSQPTQSAEPPRAVAKKEKDEPRLDLKASTCLQLATISAHSAEQPGRSQADQQQLRDKARRAYAQALKLEPKNLEALSGLGNLYVTMNDYSHAIETFRKAVDIDPSKAAAWYELGMCQSRMKEFPAALASLQKAVDLEPENRQVVHTYGHCLARAGKYDASFAVFAKVDGEAVAHYNLGRMLLHLKEEKLARQHLEQAVNLDKNLVGATKLLSQMSQGVTIGAPSPIMPVSYEKVTPVEGSVSAETQGEVINAGFTKDAAAALRRVGGNQQ